jgi:hypothetical protein
MGIAHIIIDNRLKVIGNAHHPDEGSIGRQLLGNCGGGRNHRPLIGGTLAYYGDAAKQQQEAGKYFFSCYTTVEGVSVPQM